MGDKPPPPNFGRSINPNLIQFLFFHPIGYLKINKNWFEPVLSDLILHDPILSLLIQFDLIWTDLFLLDLVWSSFIQFYPIWSNLVKVISSNLLWSDFNQFKKNNHSYLYWSNLNQLETIWSNMNQFYLIWTK